MIGPYSRLSAAFYASTSQTIWSFFIAFIIFACVNNFGGFVNTILSFEIFRPLSRTVYMIYLTHGQILILFNGTRNQLIPIEFSSLVSLKFSDLSKKSSFFKIIFDLFL